MTRAARGICDTCGKAVPLTPTGKVTQHGSRGIQCRGVGAEPEGYALTEAQAYALVALHDLRDVYEDGAFVTARTATGRAVSVTTLDALAAAGLIETEERPTCTVARITDRGIAVCHGMGD